MIPNRSVFSSALAALLIAILVVPVSAGKPLPKQLPSPDGKPADQSKPVKVFILLGQSNMLGFGRIDLQDKNGTLSHLVKKEKKYPFLIDEAGN